MNDAEIAVLRQVARMDQIAALVEHWKHNETRLYEQKLDHFIDGLLADAAVIAKRIDQIREGER